MYGGTKKEMERLMKDATKLSGIKYDITNFADMIEAVHVIQEELGITGTTALEAEETIEGSFNTMKSAFSNLVTGLAIEGANFDKLFKILIKSTKTFLDNVVPRVKIVLKNVGDALPIFIKDAIKTIMSLLPLFIKSGFEAVVAIVKGVIQAMPILVSSIQQALLDSFKAIKKAIIAKIPPEVWEFIDKLREVIVKRFGEIANQFKIIFGFFVEGSRMMVEAAKKLKDDLIAAIPQEWIAKFEEIKTKTNEIFKDMKEQLKRAGESIKKAGQKVGEATKKMKDAMMAALPEDWIKNFERIKNKTVEVSNGLGEAFDNVGGRIKEVGVRVGEVKENGVGWFAENGSGLISIVAGIGAGLTTWGVLAAISNSIQLVVAGLKSLSIAEAMISAASKATAIWSTVTKAATAAQAALNLVLLANPIALIIGLIVGVIVALVSLFAMNEKFRNFVVDTWNQFLENVPKWFDALLAFFKDLPYQLGYWLGFALGTIARWGVDVYNWIVANGPIWIDNILKFFKELPDKLRIALAVSLVALFVFGNQMKEKAKEAGTKFAETLKGKMEELPDQMKDIGKRIVEGIWIGIKNSAKWLQDQIKRFADGIIDGFKKAFQIHSPSRLMANEIGKFLPQGIGMGFEDELPAVNAEIAKSLSTTVDVTRNALDGDYDVNGKTGGNKSIMIEVPVYLEGREIARATAPYQDEFYEYTSRNPSFA